MKKKEPGRAGALCLGCAWAVRLVLGGGVCRRAEGAGLIFLLGVLKGQFRLQQMLVFVHAQGEGFSLLQLHLGFQHSGDLSLTCITGHAQQQ